MAHMVVWSVTCFRLYSQQIANNAVSLIEHVIALLLFDARQVCVACPLSFQLYKQEQLQPREGQLGNSRAGLLSGQLQGCLLVFLSNPFGADLLIKNMLGQY